MENKTKLSSVHCNVINLARAVVAPPPQDTLQVETSVVHIIIIYPWGTELLSLQFREGSVLKNALQYSAGAEGEKCAKYSSVYANLILTAGWLFLFII